MNAHSTPSDSSVSKATVIVGGGFVGLFTALRLSHLNYINPIVLIDTQARFVFKPLLYEYLSGEMHEEQVVPTYKELLQGSSVNFVQDKVTQVDLHKRRVVLASGQHYEYQYLVLAVGSTQGYFGTEGAQEHAFPFRTQTDVLHLKQHLRDSLQRASQTGDHDLRQKLLTVAIVGAGPSGVEIAATLADLLPDWYGQIGGNVQEIRIILVNHSDEILEGDINTHLRETALQALKNRTIPVELLMNVTVESVGLDQLRYRAKDKTPDQKATEILLSGTTIWTTGTATNPLIEALSLPANCIDKHGHPFVTSTLQMLNFPEVFAAGDCAIVQSHPLPPVAQIAYQQGAGIADNLVALSHGKPLEAVQAKLRGTLMKLGIHNGVANLFEKVEINGEAGDLIRNATYLKMLPSPVHDFKAITEWLTDEIFERHSFPQSAASTPPRSRQQSNWFVWIGGIALATILGLGLVLTSRFQQLFHSEPQPARQQSKP